MAPTPSLEVHENDAFTRTRLMPTLGVSGVSGVSGFQVFRVQGLDVQVALALFMTLMKVNCHRNRERGREGVGAKIDLSNKSKVDNNRRQHVETSCEHSPIL